MSQDAAVSLRTASGFVESLRDGREIWLGGERVVDVTAHPLLRGAALTIAALYGLQHRPDLQDRLSLPSTRAGSASATRTSSRGRATTCAAGAR